MDEQKNKIEELGLSNKKEEVEQVKEKEEEEEQENKI